MFNFYKKIAGIFVFTFVFSGCGSSNTETAIRNSYEGEFGVIVSSGVEELNPFSLDWQNKLRLNNVFEGLVRTDENFSIEPSLAVSWGLLGETEWEFYLRKDVKFQDGSSFEADDVISSFDLAKNNEKSEMKNIFANIESVEKIDDFRIKIKTINPDPLFLDKIASVFILNSDDEIGNINGTGAYKLVSHDSENTFLEAFGGYWGGVSEIQKAVFQNVENGVTRQEMAITNDCQKFSEIENYKCGVMTSVPLAVLDRLSADLETYKFSNLNSTYLVFNENSARVQDNNLKKALKMALNYDEIGSFGGELTYAANQFFSSGTFGHNPDLQISEQNIEEANKILPIAARGQTFILDYYSDYELLANYLHDAWRELGVNVKLNPVSSTEELKRRTVQNKNDFYIVSWQVENGDAGEFFNSSIHTADDSGNYGQFNWSSYGDENMDIVIQNSNTNMNWKERLKELRGISEFITETRPYGIPLLESKNIYAVDKNVNFVPRADGFIILSKISIK